MFRTGIEKDAGVEVRLSHLQAERVRAAKCVIVPALIALAACSPREHDGRSPGDDGASAAAQAPSSTVAPDVPAGAYTLDKAHASLIFRVNHLGFSNFTARFKRFDAQLQFDPANLSASSVVVQIDPRSIETDYPDPATLDFNAQLQGVDWLNTGQYPDMTFRSISVESTGRGAMRINGALTLRGVTHPVALEANFNGGYAGHPMDPHARIGFSAHGALSRSQFGMSFGVPEPGSTMGVGDKVDVVIEAEFNGPAWAGAAAPNS
jgi:polyisoprenoid-binding protein YceI